jgi:hypothetical protein
MSQGLHTMVNRGEMRDDALERDSRIRVSCQSTATTQQTPCMYGIYHRRVTFGHYLGAYQAWEGWIGLTGSGIVWRAWRTWYKMGI